MSFTTGLKSYPVSVASQDIPNAWLSSNDPRVASCGKKIVSIASQNGTQSAGGVLSFLLPSNMGAGMMASGSAYIRATITVTQATALSYQFRQYGSASSVVNRMTFLASGSIVEQILNYNKLYSSLLLHASSPAFATNDDTIAQCTLGGADAVPDGSQTNSLVSTVRVCIPILLGSFNSKTNLPLFLLNSAQLNVDLDSAVAAISNITAANTVEYTVGDAQLVFEQLTPDAQYEMALKQMLGQRLFQLPISTFYNVKVGSSNGALTQNIGLNASSVRAVLWNQILTADDVAGGGSQFVANGQTQAQLFLDGQLINQNSLDTTLTTGNPQQCFLEKDRCLNIMYDSNVVSVAPASYAAGSTITNAIFASGNSTRTLYITGSYLGGISCQKTNEQGFNMQGVPVNTAVLQLTASGAASTVYIYVALQQVITIDQQGSASLIR